MQHVTILGAGYAGMLAALRLHKRARVTLISRESSFNERIRLHQLAAGGAIPVRPIADMIRGTGIAFIHATATALDPATQMLTLIDGHGEQSHHRYETLIYALGSHIDRDSLAGVRDHAHTLDPRPDQPRGLAALTQIAAGGGRIVVIGGGLTGIEAASELAAAHPNAQIALISAHEIGAGVYERGRAHLRAAFARLGVTLVEKTRVRRLDAGMIATDDGGHIAADAILWAGAFAVPTLAREAGIAVNARGQIAVDARLRSVSHPAIIAAGDSAAVGVRMACASAMPMGAYAADAALGSDAPFAFGFIAQCISLGRGDGLIQFVRGDDTPTDRIITGGAAARFKEAICRFTTAALAMERRFPGVYLWRKTPLEQPAPWVQREGIA
jgi:NADH dehydrogenase FAD-containing subunit